MTVGRKTGGRKAGTPNKRTQAVADKLAALDCDPIEGMARIAQQFESEGEIEKAAKLYVELAPDLFPKRKVIEVSKQPEELPTRADVEALRAGLSNVPRGAQAAGEAGSRRPRYQGSPCGMTEARKRVEKWIYETIPSGLERRCT